MAYITWYFTCLHKQDCQNRRNGRRRCELTDEPPVINNGMGVSRHEEEFIQLSGTHFSMRCRNPHEDGTELIRNPFVSSQFTDQRRDDLPTAA